MDIGWIHFSDTFRNRVNTFLETMEDEGTVDELGIGVFRDGFADLFFPGISTIQTRAKYFFIIPYIMKDFLRRPKSQKIALEKYLYAEEDKIMWQLAAKYNHDRNSGSGVIGITKRHGKSIARRASSIYWNGIREFDFIDTNLSLLEFCQKINQYAEDQLDRTIKDLQKGLADDADAFGVDPSTMKVSTYKPNWIQDLDLPLSYDEASFFSQKIKDEFGNTLLGQIIALPSLRRKFLAAKDFSVFTGNILSEIKSKGLQRDLILSHDLNVIVYGLSLAYSNEINKRFYNQELFLDDWNEWKESLYAELLDVNNLDAEQIILYAPRANLYAQNFLRDIIYQVKSGNLDYEKIASSVITQERNSKGRKSRFRNGVESDIQVGEKKSLSFLNYRFTNARQIVKDITEGLKNYA